MTDEELIVRLRDDYNLTQAFYIDLGFGDELPKVKGSDDAEKAFWVPFNEVKQEKMFENHFFIIDNFLNIG